MKKLITLLLLLTMTVTIYTTSLASNLRVSAKTSSPLDQPGTARTPVVLTAEAVQFSVVVPTSLPVHISSNGRVTTSENAKFINRSHAPVRLTQAEIHAAEGWILAPYGQNMDPSSQEIGFAIEGMTTKSKGNSELFLFNQKKIRIPGKSPGSSQDIVFPLDYDVKVPVQTKSIANEVRIADVVFTLTWDR